jgi:L-2-amino-thiazoline-4-carboxylic acid hydrolase
MLNEREQSIIQAVIRLAKVLIEELGEEEAFHLLRRWIREIGMEHFLVLSQRLELPPEEARAGFALAKAIGENLGMRPEVIEDTPKRVRYRVKECPIAAACDRVGVPGQSLCNRVISPALNNIMGSVFPGLKWSVEWGPIGGCRYQIGR